jgi:hypothetical protein
MRQVTIVGMSGNAMITSDGATVYACGNRLFNVGDVAWVDGNIAFGHETGGGALIVDSIKGIPVNTSTEYGYIKTSSVQYKKLASVSTQINSAFINDDEHAYFLMSGSQYNLLKGQVVSSIEFYELFDGCVSDDGDALYAMVGSSGYKLYKNGLVLVDLQAVMDSLVQGKASEYCSTHQAEAARSLGGALYNRGVDGDLEPDNFYGYEQLPQPGAYIESGNMTIRKIAIGTDGTYKMNCTGDISIIYFPYIPMAERLTNPISYLYWAWCKTRKLYSFNATVENGEITYFDIRFWSRNIGLLYNSKDTEINGNYNWIDPSNGGNPGIKSAIFSISFPSIPLPDGYYTDGNEDVLYDPSGARILSDFPGAPRCVTKLDTDKYLLGYSVSIILFDKAMETLVFYTANSSVINNFRLIKAKKINQIKTELIKLFGGKS